MPPRKAEIHPWESLTDAESGRLARPAPFDRLWVPQRVWLEGDELCFGLSSSWQWVKVPAGLLERFLSLRNDSQFLKFAARFGSLGDWPTPDYSVVRAIIRGELEPDGNALREGLTDWRDRQWEFGKLLAIAAALRAGESFEGDVFAAFAERGIHVPAGAFLGDLLGITSPVWSNRTPGQRRSLAQGLLLHRANELVRSCRIRPALVAPDSRTGFRLELVFSGDNKRLSLMGALVVQLLANATGSGFVSCSSCGTVFVPRRRQPAFGKRRYCRDCGRPAALRDAKAAYRARLRRRNSE